MISSGVVISGRDSSRPQVTMQFTEIHCQSSHTKVVMQVIAHKANSSVAHQTQVMVQAMDFTVSMKKR